MTKVTNISTGPRGIHAVGGALIMIDVGQSEDIDLPDGEIDDDSEWFSFDADEKGLSGHSVTELKSIAASEGVDLGDATKKADIVTAIELAREEAAKV